MQTVGRVIGELMLSAGEDAALQKARTQVRALLLDKPLFSAEWLPANINLTPGYGQKDLNITHELEAEKKRNQAERMLSFWDS